MLKTLESSVIIFRSKFHSFELLFSKLYSSPTKSGFNNCEHNRRRQLRNSQQISRNLIHYGAINPPTWSFDLSIADSNFHWVSNLSTVGCNSSAGSYLPGIQLNWTGSGGVISGSEITGVTSSGVLTCTLSDAFGNVALSSLNLTYDNSNPSVSISLPTTSGTLNGTNYVQSGGDPFSISYGDNQTGISSTTYCISSTSNCPSWQSISSTTIPLGTINGSRTLFVNITNGVGVSILEDISYVQDDIYPTISVQNNSNTIIDNLVIYAGVSSPSISVQLGDDNCISNGTLYHDVGSFSIPANSSPIIPQSSSWIRLDAVDCVGHLTSSNYTVNWINSIPTSNITIDVNHLQTGILVNSSLTFDGSIVLNVVSNHPLQLDANCSSSSIFVLIQCEDVDANNRFDMTLNYSGQTIEFVSIHYTDELGNSINQTLQISVDNIGPNCEPESSAILVPNSQTDEMVLPSNRNSLFSCTDNALSVTSVYWQQGVSKIFWIKSNSTYWDVPPPLSGQVTIVAEDELGNTNLFEYNVTHDDIEPMWNISSTNKISFDEEITRSDGSFRVSCQDNTTSDCLIDVTQVLVSSGQIIYSSRFQGNGLVSIANPSSTVRVDIVLSDLVNNQISTSKVFSIDNVATNLDIVNKDVNGVLITSQGISSYQGTINLDGLLSSDVNISKSIGATIKCIQPSLQQVSLPIQSQYQISDYQLENCSRFRFTLSASDHVGNIQYESSTYLLDRVVPSVNFTSDSSCSWQSEEYTDMQSFCQISVEIIDDESPLLRSQYQLSIRELDSSVSDQYSISNSFVLASLGEYVGKTLIISVTGSDLAGNPVESNLLRVQIRDKIEPRWEGLVCLEFSGCGFNNTVTATSVNDIINISTYYGQAPISEISIVFENALSSYSYTSTSFVADSVPDGIYSLSIDLEDEAGRYLNTGNINFIYDNQAPNIELLATQSVGLLNENLVLSCDECKLVWRISDVTDTISTTNHGNYPIVEGQYEMSTAVLGENQITISATDEFGRVTTVNLNSTSIKSTEISPVETILEKDGVKILCLEQPPSQGSRQVVCLWTRVETNVEYLPIELNIFVDQLQLRPVSIVIQKSGEGTETQGIQMSEGVIEINGIQDRLSEFNLSIRDDYSDISPIRFKLIEHTQPWSNLEFRDVNLAEYDSSSEFDVVITAPQEEIKFHLLSKYSVNELFSCNSLYKYRDNGRDESMGDIQNCQINSSQISPNNELTLRVYVEHENLPTHDNYELFNLESYSLIISYSDPLGVNSNSNPWDLKISSDEIERAPDSIPVLNLPDSSKCALGNEEIIKHDGFLQDDKFINLFECSEYISDFDEIETTIWEFDFKIGNDNSYIVEIECTGTHFPEYWDFDSSFDKKKCFEPSRSFPDGSGYDVLIKLTVVDSSEFRDNKINQKLHRLTDDCLEDYNECEVVTLMVREVTVSSTWNPLADIENTRNLEDWSSELVSSNWYLLASIGSGTSILLLCGYFYSRRSNWSFTSIFSNLNKKLRDMYQKITSKLGSSQTEEDK